MPTLRGKCIVVGIGGGIAAYKAVFLVRELLQRGATVRVVMSESATRFVGPLTLAGITGESPVIDLWDARYPGEVHVELGRSADAMVVAPATQNLLARAAAGMADDAILATVSCLGETPAYFAPAMHTRMWTRPSTQRSVAVLRGDGARILGPEIGELASGETGEGRMLEPAAIVDALERDFSVGSDLEGQTLLVTAGPTVEDIDPVRFLSNRSSGIMGYAIARRALSRGARVLLISGPVAVVPPPGAEFVSVRSSEDMRAAVMARASEATAVIMAAAVADYRIAEPSSQKIKKREDRIELSLVKNTDILAELGATRGADGPVLVGFALETERVIEHAQEKLSSKRVDLIVANAAETSLGGLSTQAAFVKPNAVENLSTMTKEQLADALLDEVRTLSQTSR